jgi:hypothetical protein
MCTSKLHDSLVLKVVVVTGSDESEYKLLIYCKPQMLHVFQALEG